MGKLVQIPFEIEGVNKTLFLWALESKIMKQFLNEDNLLQELLQKILGKNEEQRELASLTFYQHIWSKYPEFGANLLINLLPDFEHDRVFYDNYRDHTTHMVKCFLLGVYFYENCQVFNEKEHNSELFLKTWTLAVLYHDIGYIFENELVNPQSKHLERILKLINKSLFAPLANVPYFSQYITEVRERNWIDKYRIYTGNIHEISEFEREDFFEIFSEFSQITKLGTTPETNGIYKYYQYAHSEKTKDGRSGFRDHGICSALIFQKLWNCYKDYLIDISYKDEILNDLDQEVQRWIKRFREEVPQNSELIRLALGAIALHNVSKDLWDEANAYVLNLDLRSFSISLKKKNLFYAFLLRLCDEIQMWDRMHYRKPQASDKNLYGSDLNIQATKSGIYISFEEDGRFRHPENEDTSRYNILINTLGKYLEPGELKHILLCRMPEELDSEDNLGEMSKPPVVDLKINNPHKSIEELQPWVVGAVNIDEDIHFSSYYLRQSMKKNLPDMFKEFGYDHIIAIYEDFNETYYIPLKECENVSNNLIKQALRNPLFLESIIDETTKLINELKSVFDFEPNRDMFLQMSDSSLLNYYQKHDDVHTRLYVYSRIPEALDRGVSTFTNYLKSYLKGRSPELQDGKKLNEVFEILTYPENISLSGMEILELNQLIIDIKAIEKNSQYRAFSGRGKRTLVRMNYETQSKIENFANKWAFWGYHGYGHRAIRDFNYFVEKLKIEIDNPDITVLQKKLVDAAQRAAAERIISFSTYNIDENHQLLFRAFSKIGTIKILRRYYQLRNFFYLDNLIFAIARRYKVSEDCIRCLLPNEVISLLNGNVEVLTRGKERAYSHVFAVSFSDSGETFATGNAAKNLYDKMKKLTSVNTLNAGQLKGDTASLGRYKGTCRIVTRTDEVIFEKGDIFVGVDADPDLFDQLKIAGAVLTESGGLTCHAAIVCRELKIPCIVRINGLMDGVKDGDILDVDADNGLVTISTSISKNIIRSLHAKEFSGDSTTIGKKAFALMQMKANNFLVPDFFCIPYSVLKKVFNNIDMDNMGQESQALILEIKQAVKELGGPLFAIRSSTSAEDLDNFSGAGQEITELRVAKDNVINTIMRLVSENESDLKNGSIIVQKMIMGDLSGVIFTQNPIKNTNSMLIEAVPGGNEYLTSGKVSPAMYTCDSSSFEFVEDNGDFWKGLLSETVLEKLKETAQKLEKLFSAPQDIEWTILKDRLYILQSRNITGQEQVDGALIRSHKGKVSRNILSIYQVYGLPINLQMHMLRVTAVAMWILERWIGDDLNRKEIEETLLLHDIGNLVKVPEEKFESLFPDTYPIESFQYWRNIRESIIKRYGKTDTEATLNIVKEINVSESIIHMIEKKQFVNNKETYLSQDFAIKICAYADQRVSPNGVLSLENRLNEAIIRYRGVENASVNSPNREALIEYAKKIEEQIFKFVHGKPEDITDAAIQNYIEELKLFNFS